MKRFLLIACMAVIAAVSCKKQEYVVYDNPYVYVVWADDATLSESSTILSKANGAVRTYNVCLSSKRRDAPLSINYEITHGNGLEHGVDFTVEAESGSLTFEPGVYMATLDIKFLRHTVSKDTDNTLTIRLTGASVENMTLGLPGSVPKNASHTIKKVN